MVNISFNLVTVRFPSKLDLLECYLGITYSRTSDIDFAAERRLEPYGNCEWLLHYTSFGGAIWKPILSGYAACINIVAFNTE